MHGSINIKNISKTFAKIKALSNVSFTIEAGTAHAVVGENGAGKSTLMKILGGVYKPDVGEIFIDDKSYRFNSVRESANAGISVIYQELNILSELNVAENILLCRLPRKLNFFLDKNNLIEAADEILSRLEIPLNPRTYAKELNVSEKQMVEIARAVSFNSDIIIMDEPTASLNSQEAKQLFNIIEALKRQGRTILYITHRMKELFDIADKVTVLRDGIHIATRPIQEVSHNDIVKLMVGRTIGNFYKSGDNVTDQPLLSVLNLTSKGFFSDISITVQSGEIFGVAGLLGCGNVEMAKALYGLHSVDSGEIRFLGDVREDINVTDSLEKGISFLTDDRKESGIFKLMGVKQNITITILERLVRRFSRLLKLKDERHLFDVFSNRLKLNYSGEDQKAENLSGGNQQKLLLARALASNCRLLILLEPTKGVDVGTKAEVYELLQELTKSGMAVLLVTSDLPELISISNRIAVMCQGRITGIVEGRDISEESVMKLATAT